MRVLCLMSLNVALHFKNSSECIPEELRGAKVLVDSLMIIDKHNGRHDIAVACNGQTISFEDVSVTIGVEGSSANVAGILRKLGQSPVIAAAIGNDDFGQVVTKYLNGQGIEFFPFRYQGATAVTVAVTDEYGSTTLFCHKPTVIINNDFFVYGLRRMKIRPSYVVATSVRSDQLSVVRAVFEEFPKSRKAVIPHHDLLLQESIIETPEFRDIVTGADVFQVNEREANALHKGGGHEGTSFSMDDLERLTTRLANDAKLPGVMIVTLGERGAATVAFNNGRSEVLSHRAHQVNAVVDTTGCGDCFLAGYIHAEALGRRHGARIDFASWVAAENAKGHGGHCAAVDEHSIKLFS